MGTVNEMNLPDRRARIVKEIRHLEEAPCPAAFDDQVQAILTSYDADLAYAQAEAVKVERERYAHILWLMAEDVLFISHQGESPFVQPAIRKEFKHDWFEFSLNMNDTFYYATADAESIKLNEVAEVKAIYEKFGVDGLTAMVAIKRNCEPLEMYRTERYHAAKEALTNEDAP